MEDNKDFKTPPRRGRMGGPRGMGMAPEKAKDFKGSISKLMSYIGRYKIGIFAVMLFAAVATVFNVIGLRFSVRPQQHFLRDLCVK